MASVRKRGATWVLDWRENGKQFRKSLGKISKQQADRALKVKEYELVTGKSAYNVHTFLSFASDYTDWHRVEFPDSHSRIEKIISMHLIPEFGGDQIAKIDPMKVELWKQKRRNAIDFKGKHPKIETINKELTTLKAVVNKAVEWDIIGKNPLHSVKPIKGSDSKPHNYYTVDQLNLIYEHDPRNAPIWRLLANTGMRRKEAMNLKWDCVLGKHIRIISVEGARTKSQGWRDVPISPGCRKALSELEGGEFVLPRKHKYSWSRAFKKNTTDLGLSGSLHDLRHTFISHLVMQGVSLRTVQVLAGHSKMTVTEGYAHLSPDHMVDAVSELKL